MDERNERQAAGRGEPTDWTDPAAPPDPPRARLDYDEEADVLYVSLRVPPRAVSHEGLLSDGVLVGRDGHGQIVGLTILDAAHAIRRTRPLRDFTHRDDVFLVFRRDDRGCEQLMDVFSRARAAEDWRDLHCAGHSPPLPEEAERLARDGWLDDPARYRIERRRVYLGVIGGI